MKVSSFWHKKCCDFFLVECAAPPFRPCAVETKIETFCDECASVYREFSKAVFALKTAGLRTQVLSASKGGFRGRHCICEMQRTLYVVLVCISSLHIVLWIPSAVFCSTGPRHLANWSAYMRPIYLLEGRLVARYFSRAKCRFATILGRYWLRSTTDA